MNGWIYFIFISEATVIYSSNNRKSISMLNYPYKNTSCFFLIIYWNSLLQVLGSQPDRWAIGPNPTWCSAWTTKGQCAWRLRAPSKTPKSSSNSTSHSRRRPPTTGRPGLVRRPEGRERITARIWVLGSHGLSVLCCPRRLWWPWKTVNLCRSKTGTAKKPASNVRSLMGNW